MVTRGAVGRRLRGVKDKGRDAGYRIVTRARICIARGILLIYLVKDLKEVGILLFIRTGNTLDKTID